MRRLGTLASAGVMLAATALAQTTDYTSFDAMPGKPIEIGNYAAIGANCSAGAPPTIKVVEPPRSGTLSVRSGERVYTVANCPPIKSPAEVMTYEARDGASGTDRLVYDIVSATGQVSTKDVTIRLAVPPAPAPPRKPDIKF
jgi:hypothetical protein